jgi:SSS family solute:Na+ symporter
MGYTTLAILAILLYTILNLYVGLGRGYKKEVVSSASGYFLGGGTDYFILFFTTAATWFSTWLYMGAVGSFYKNGIGFIAGMLWQLVIMMFMGIFGIKFWIMANKYDYITPADLLDDYYQSKALRLIVAIGQLIFCIPYLMAQVTGTGLAVSTLTGGIIPYWGGVIYAAVVVGLYVYFGGFRSQAWVDTMQGIMFTIILWVSVILMLLRPEVGGISGLFIKLAERTNLLKYLTLPNYWNWSMYLSFFIIQSFGGFFAPYVWQRMYAAKNGNIVRKMSGTLGPFYTLVIMLPVMLAGFCGAILFPKIDNPDNILVATMAKYYPIWGIFVVIGIMAAGMSTISSILVSASSIISVDLVKQYKPDMTTVQLRNLGRYIVLILLAVAVAFSMVKIQAILILVNVALAGFAQLVFPVIGVFAWKRATKEGAIAGLIVGLVLTIFFTVVIPNPLHTMAGIWGLLGNATVFFGVSLLTNSIPSREIQNKFTILQ